MESIVAYITAHSTDILATGAAFVLFFDRLAKLTPTTVDDGVVSTLYKVFAFLGVKVQDNPGTPPAP